MNRQTSSYVRLIENEFNQPIEFRLTKIANIFYVGIMYMIFGSIISIFINYIYPVRDEETCKKMNIIRLGIEFILLSSILFVMCYIVRNIVRLIGSPIDGYNGFKYQQLKELNGGIVLSLALICYSKKLFTMSKIFNEKLLGLVDN